MQTSQRPSKTKRKLPVGTLDVRRMACIAGARPSDHSLDVLMVPDPHFDIEKTIFKTVDIPKIKHQMAKKMGQTVYWNDQAIARVLRAYGCIPRSVPVSNAILEFVEEHCEFDVEHADGSFMDHLTFCYDYSLNHLPGHSPRTLFLHSVMGTGTNVFPLTVDKVPLLESLLSPEEFTQVEAFPSILRLLHTFALPSILLQHKHKLARLTSITFHRVIDNVAISMTGAQLWTQLNYQLIHELDFLPLTDWADQVAAGSFQALRSVHACLVAAGQLQVNVDLDLYSKGKSGSLSLRDALAACDEAKTRKQRETYAWFHRHMSAKIGHSLDFQLEFDASPSSL